MPIKVGQAEVPAPWDPVYPTKKPKTAAEIGREMLAKAEQSKSVVFKEETGRKSGVAPPAGDGPVIMQEYYKQLEKERAESERIREEGLAREAASEAERLKSISEAKAAERRASAITAEELKREREQIKYYITKEGRLTYRVGPKAQKRYEGRADIKSPARPIAGSTYFELSRRAKKGEDISKYEVVGYTPYGGTYKVPITATVKPKEMDKLTKLTGEETTKELIGKYRGAEIKGFDVGKTLYGGRLLTEYKDPMKTIEPDVAYLGGLAGRSIYEKELKEYKKSMEEYEKAKGARLQEKSIVSDVTGFETRVKGLKEREERFFGSAGFERIRGMARVMTGGKAYEEKGFLGKTAELGLYYTMAGPIALGGSLVSTGEKIAATGEALSRKDTRGLALSELGRAGKETIKLYDPTKPEGAATYLTAGLFALPQAAGAVIAGRGGFGPSTFKLKPITEALPRSTPEGLRVLQKVAKEKPIDLTIKEYSTYKLGGLKEKAMATIDTAKVKVSKRGFVTTEYNIMSPKKGLSVIEGLDTARPLKGTITPEGVQFTSRAFGKKYQVTQKTTPIGERTTKIFKSGKDDPLLIYKEKLKPEVIFEYTKPESAMKAKTFLSKQEFTAERGRQVFAQRSFEIAKTKGKYVPQAKAYSLFKERLTVMTKQPRRTVIQYKPFEVDIGTGKIKPSSTYAEIGGTRYKFVDYFKEPKKYRLKETESFLMEERPAVSVAEQVIQQKGIFRVTYKKRPYEISPAFTRPFMGKRAQVAIQRQRQVRIKRPPVKFRKGTTQYFGKGFESLTRPTSPKVSPLIRLQPKVTTRPAEKLRKITRPKTITRPELKQAPTPKTILDPKIVLRPKIKQVQTPKTDLSLKQITKPRLRQKTKPFGEFQRFKFTGVDTPPFFIYKGASGVGGADGFGLRRFTRPLKGRYKPSVYGIEEFKRTGKALKAAPKFTAGFGVRAPTKKQIKRLQKTLKAGRIGF